MEDKRLMGIEISRLYWAECDKCGKFFRPVSEKDGFVYYRNEDELIKKLMAYGWSFSETRVLCKDCKIE